MRRHSLILLLVAGSAAAEPKRANDKPKPIDVKPVADKLDVYKDDLGNYYVTPKAGAFGDEDTSPWLFYGDGKTLYQQRVIGFSVEPPAKQDWVIWSPRARGMVGAMLLVDADKAWVECKHKDGKRPLTALKADEVKTLFKRATFLPALWIRQSHFLARDDDGVYYFVDMLREDYGGNGYRVYVGMKGEMKELPMTNRASDSAGEIFATKTGQLKIITGRDGKAYWIKGGKKVELTPLEPGDNKYLIYRELGIYGQLGVLCDDL